MTSLALEQARASLSLKLKRAALPVLLAVFVLLGGLYAIVTPLFEVSDELWHYPMVKTLADGQGLPVQNPANPGPWRQEGSQPPLYYTLMAAATFVIIPVLCVFFAMQKQFVAGITLTGLKG